MRMPHGHLFRTAFEGATDSEIAPLAKVLDVDHVAPGFVRASDIDRLWHQISYYGSNNIAHALRGFEGVDYPEIVRDVCKHMKVTELRDGDDPDAVEHNEQRLVGVVFSQMYATLTAEEQRALLEGMNLSQVGAQTSSVTGLVVAQFLARAVLSRAGIGLVAEGVAGRIAGAALGPLGWLAAGAWLTSPAYRKTVPAVVYTACLRMRSRQRWQIGVLGSGSVGKDSLIHAVFGIDTQQVHPIPGTTDRVDLYRIDLQVPTEVLNFPGFGDLRPEVEDAILEQAAHCHLILYLFHGAEVPKRDELQQFQHVSKLIGRNGEVPIVPILNKFDKADPDERQIIVAETARRLGRDDVVGSCFKPKPGLELYDLSVQAVRTRINLAAQQAGRTAPFAT